MGLKITNDRFATLSAALAELQQIETEVTMLESRRAILRTEVTAIAAQVHADNAGAQIPGINLTDQTEFEYDPGAAEAFVRDPMNAAACAQAFKILSDKVGLILGVSLKHPEFNLNAALQFDSRGYAAMLRNGAVAGMPYTAKKPKTGIQITGKHLLAGADLAALFDIVPDQEPDFLPTDASAQD